MKTLLAVLIVGLTASFSHAKGLTDLRDGKIVFAMYNINGEGVYSDEDKQRILDSQVDLGTGTITESDFTAYVPPAWEVNLSTCIAFETDRVKAFDSWGDWKSCQTKKGLKRKIKMIRIELDSMQDLPASDLVDIKQRMGWIKSYYQSLP